jgi:hypothetical protein
MRQLTCMHLTFWQYLFVCGRAAVLCLSRHDIFGRGSTTVS